MIPAKRPITTRKSGVKSGAKVPLAADAALYHEFAVVLLEAVAVPDERTTITAQNQ